MASLIDSWKNKGWLPEKVNTHESFKFADGKGRKVYEIYQARLKVLNACDFGDLLLHNLTLFMENPDILKREHILGAASGLIAANQGRLGKTLWTEDDGGHKVTVTGVWDAPTEARLISDEIESWRHKGRKYNDVAILVEIRHR